MTTCTTRAAETWAHLIAEVDPMPVSIAADFATDDGSEPAEACAAVEAVAQQHLDAHPDDHRARRLLGEWLQWHGDVRGEGYRALASLLRYPDDFLSQWYWTSEARDTASCTLPEGWLVAMPNWGEAHPETPTYRPEDPETTCTRHAAEDAAALAFARLPDERRVALLKGEMGWR